MTRQQEPDPIDAEEEEWVPPPRKPPPPPTLDRWRIRFADGREIALRFQSKEESRAVRMAKDPTYKPRVDPFDTAEQWTVDDGNDWDSLEEWEDTPEGWDSLGFFHETMERAAERFFAELVDYRHAVALLRPYEQVTIAVRAARAVTAPPVDTQPTLPGVGR